jgi:hypothetical protein
MMMMLFLSYSMMMMLFVVGMVGATETTIVQDEDRGTCLMNRTLEAIFSGGNNEVVFPQTCCQFDVCGVPCPEPVPRPSSGTLLVATFSYKHFDISC